MFVLTESLSTVVVDFQGTLENEKEIDDFLLAWKTVLETRIGRYNLVFHTRHAIAKVEYLRYAKKFAEFLKSSRHLFAYVSQTEIHLASKTFQLFLQLVLSFYDPVSPVFIRTY